MIVVMSTSDFYFFLNVWQLDLDWITKQIADTILFPTLYLINVCLFVFHPIGTNGCQKVYILMHLVLSLIDILKVEIFISSLSQYKKASK